MPARDYAICPGPLIRLDILSHSEIFLLLQTILKIHATHHKTDARLADRHLQAFMSVVLDRIGADTLLTPREVLRDFVALLNLLQQNPGESFESLVGEVHFTTGEPYADPEALTPTTEIHEENGSSPYASFQI